MKKTLLWITVAVATAATSLTYGADGRVIEFYNSLLDNYFIVSGLLTASGIEVRSRP